MEIKKISYISNIKAIAILSVVIYHCICPFTPMWTCSENNCISELTFFARLINSLAMPIFFILAGYLFFKGKIKGKYSNIKQFILNKTSRLVLPFAFWGIIVWLLLSSKSLLNFFIYGASHLWFLGALFLMFLFFSFPILTKTTKKQDLILEISLFTLSCLSLKIPNNPGFIIYQTINYSYIFFFGIILAKHSFSFKFPLLSLFVSISLLLFSILFFDFTYGQILVKTFSLTTTILLLYNAALSFNKDFVLCKKIEEQSMGIYILHHILLQLILSTPQFSLSYYKSILFLFPLILFSISYLLSYLIRKTFLSKTLG